MFRAYVAYTYCYSIIMKDFERLTWFKEIAYDFLRKKSSYSIRSGLYNNQYNVCRVINTRAVCFKSETTLMTKCG